MISRDEPMVENPRSTIHWAEMITAGKVEDQCATIARWLKQHCRVRGLALSVQDHRLARPFLYTETIPGDVIRRLEEILPKDNQIEGPGDQVRFFDLSEDDVLLTAPLATKNHHIGTLAVLADSHSIQSLMGEDTTSCWLSPLISHLLDNSITHEYKDRKIRMLNLYQTVSSSISYVGDLHELLSTIMSIVTAELFCEEGSVILLDEHNNEFEFFTAVGETAGDIIKTRFPADKGIAGKALKERKSLIANDAQSSPDFYPAIDSLHDFKTKSILAAPLISGEQPVGVIEAINKLGNKHFDREDQQILAAIADEVALAVKNAKLFDYVVDSYCKIRQGQNSCKGCKRPLKSWTPCVRQLELQ